MRFARTLILSLLVFFALATSPTRAATINDEGAARLKTMFETILNEQSRLMRDGAKLQRRGEVTVEQADNYYAVTLPYLQVLHNDGSRFKLGIISINAAPHTKGGQWKMTIAFPTHMATLDRNDNETFRVTIGGQQAAGIFHEDTRQFSKLDAQYRNLQIESLTPAREVSIDAITMRFDFNEGQNGYWSGPGYIAVNNMQAKRPDGFKVASVGEIKGSFQVDQWNPAAQNTYRERLMALAEKGALDAPKMSEQDSKELGAALLDVFTKGLNGFQNALAVSDLTLSKPSSLDGKTETINIDNAKIAFDMKGFFSDSVNLGVNFAYNGFDLSSMPTQDKDVIPNKANIDIQVKNVPYKQLMNIGENTMNAANNDPKQAMQLAGLTLMMKLPAVLSQAGTRIELSDNVLGNALYNATLNAAIKADLAAVNNATANASLVFQGLDALIERTQTIAANPDNKNAASIGNLNDQLRFLQSIGKQQGDTYTFDFVMDAQGQMLMNGQDLKALATQKRGGTLTPQAATPPQ